MTPFLDPGDRIGVKWLSGKDWDELAVGDLVMARNPQGGWILHRILDCPEGNGLWTTKGDASLTAETFEKNELWGRVVAVKRQGAGPEILLTKSPLDFWIARCSRQTINSSRAVAAFCRRASRGLGWLRRLTA